MRFAETQIPGAMVIDPTPHGDHRGRFMRAWCTDEMTQHGIDFVPLQANMGRSTSAGTVRGLHFQVAPSAEAKLVRCTAGAIFDVLVDLRQGSPTLGQWTSAELSSENGRMLYVPPMCAHGYQTLTENAEIYYLTSAVYAPSAVRGLRYDDPTAGIKWPLPVSSLSDQDAGWPFLQDLLERERSIAPR
jgi:dTDP-4-dehydrorhamnose 3,5-epimerase